MKIRKRADQKNFTIATDMHHTSEILSLVNEGYVEYLFESYRLFTCYCTEIKVVCYNGYYYNVATLINGKEIFVDL